MAPLIVFNSFKEKPRVTTLTSSIFVEIQAKIKELYSSCTMPKHLTTSSTLGTSFSPKCMSNRVLPILRLYAKYEPVIVHVCVHVSVNVSIWMCI